MTNKKYPVSEDGKTCNYHGYTFHRNGTVKSPGGKTLKPLKENRASGNHVTLIFNTDDGRNLVRVNVARAIYSMFSGEALDNNEIVTFKNGDFCDYRYENLKKVTMKEYINNTPGITNFGRKRMFSKKQADRIKQLYEDGKSFVKIAAKYNCSVITVQKICRDQYYVEENV